MTLKSRSWPRFGNFIVWLILVCRDHEHNVLDVSTDLKKVGHDIRMVYFRILVICMVVYKASTCDIHCCSEVCRL